MWNNLSNLRKFSDALLGLGEGRYNFRDTERRLLHCQGNLSFCDLLSWLQEERAQLLHAFGDYSSVMQWKLL
jgi:hypothetical protein